MSGHLCLKWNNHSSAFLKSFSNIQSKGRFCDATIVCQGRYFPVHRIILSTCSDYFEEIFERIQCQHPYVVFKDIEPREMELLLNYMYQGEVNVIQEMLPMLIKAAEALRVKGLAVPDDMPSSKDSSGKKRSNSTDDDPQPKRRLEEKRRRKDATDFGINSQSETSAKEERLTRNMEGKDSENIATLHSAGQLKNETFIKQEPLESCKFSDDILPIHGSVPSLPNESQLSKKDDGIFVNFPVADDSSSCIKKEEIVSTDESFEEKAPSWTDSDTAIFMQNLPHTTVDKQDGCSTWDNNVGNNSNAGTVKGECSVWDNNVSNNSNAGTVKGECSAWDNNVSNNSNAGTVKGECSTWDNNVGNNSNAGTVKGECSTWDNNVSNNSNAGTVKGECSTWDNNASNNSNAGTVQGERSTWDDNVNNNSNAATVQGESYEINLGLKSVMDSQNEYFAAPFQVVREEGSDFSSEHNNFKSTSQCHFCSYKTTNKYRLERHTMFKHKGYRPFPCPVCPLRCTLRTDLERHMLIHTGEKPFECPKCKFKFRRKSHLKKHLDKSHCKQQSCEERQNALNLTL